MIIRVCRDARDALKAGVVVESLNIVCGYYSFQLAEYFHTLNATAIVSGIQGPKLTSSSKRCEML